MTHESVRPGPDQAHDALLAVAASRRSLAPFIGSPRWLYPVQGLGMGLFIVGLVLYGSRSWAAPALAASIVIFCVLPVLQSRRSRVLVDVYTHRGSRAVAAVYVGSFAVLVAAALAWHAATGADWLVYLMALLAFVLSLVCGPAMERKLAASVRNTL